MNKLLILILIVLVSVATPVVAEDGMELQRCIWSCLANAKGNDDPAYHSCVKKFCTEKPSESKKDRKQKACDGGAAWECYNLGLEYEFDEGIEQDDFKAAKYYRKACDGGYARGCEYLERMHDKGKGVK